MYKYFKIVFYSLTLLSFESLYGQNQDSLAMVNSKSQLEFTILYNIAKYNDSLSNNIYSNGVLFFRFKINPNGKIEDIVCAEKQPSILINIIKEILLKTKYPETNDSCIYILPILYDYSRDPGWEFENIENLKAKYTARYNVDDLESCINVNYNGLFDVNPENKNLWGIKCTFLPWISISRPIIYNYKNSIKLKTQKKGSLK